MIPSTPSRPHASGSRRLWALALSGVIACALVSCAPEPGATPAPGDVAGSTSKEDLANGTGGSEGSWSEENPDGVGEKTTEIPDGFPVDEFVVPDGAQIDDAGERSTGGWFLVLRAEDTDAGALLWTQIITDGGFTATDVTDGEDRETFATLTNATLGVDALMIPQDDGTVLLSYEIARIG